MTDVYACIEANLLFAQGGVLNILVLICFTFSLCLMLFPNYLISFLHNSSFMFKFTHIYSSQLKLRHEYLHVTC